MAMEVRGRPRQALLPPGQGGLSCTSDAGAHVTAVSMSLRRTSLLSRPLRTGPVTDHLASIRERRKHSPQPLR